MYRLNPSLVIHESRNLTQARLKPECWLVTYQTLATPPWKYIHATVMSLYGQEQQKRWINLNIIILYLICTRGLYAIIDVYSYL